MWRLKCSSQQNISQREASQILPRALILWARSLSCSSNRFSLVMVWPPYKLLLVKSGVFRDFGQQKIWRDNGEKVLLRSYWYTKAVLKTPIGGGKLVTSLKVNVCYEVRGDVIILFRVYTACHLWIQYWGVHMCTCMFMHASLFWIQVQIEFPMMPLFLFPSFYHLWKKALKGKRWFFIFSSTACLMNW